MAEYVTIKVFVCLNEDGEYVASSDEETCHDEFDGFEGHEKRSYVFKIEVPLPKTEEVAVTVPEGQNKTHLKLVT